MQPLFCHTSKLVEEDGDTDTQGDASQHAIASSDPSGRHQHGSKAPVLRAVCGLGSQPTRLWDSASQALPLETPVLLGDLPGGGSASGRVANCLPLGNDGKYFLIGVSLYNEGNVWGLPDPPEDWNSVPKSTTSGDAEGKAAKSKDVWPYNVFSGHGEAHPGRK